MILGFKTNFKDGSLTYFVQKILASKFPHYAERFTPKIHSIRKGSRWKVGNTIHMATGVRTKDYFHFNGGAIGMNKVVSVQDILIERCEDLPIRLLKPNSYVRELATEENKRMYCKAFRVQVDNFYLSVTEIKQLAINDGFNDANSFFDWFYDDFTGQIIHWTDKQY